jgi:hypothetical protein
MSTKVVQSNVVSANVPASGFSMTAASGFLGGQSSEGYANAAYPSGPIGSINPSNATLAGFPVAAMYVNSNNSGDEEFLVALTGAPLNAVWHISFTDSNGVLWDILSTNMASSVQGPVTVWDIFINGFATPYPLFINGVTYPITVHA